jgi:hypothetical protein
MSTREAYPHLLASLDEVRRRWRLYAVTEGILWTLAGVVCVLLVAVAADNLLQPEGIGRWLLAALLWGTLAATLLSWVVRRVLEDRRDDFFAALVEQKHPELHNLFINALQLGRGNQAGFSPPMIDAIIHDAAEATADLELAANVDSRRLRRAGLCAVSVLVLVGLFASPLTPWVANGVIRLVAPTSYITAGGLDRFGNGLVRVLLPFADVAPFSATRVVVKQDQDSTRVPEGEPVVIAAHVEGALPPAARLHYRSDAERWDSAPTPPEAGRGDTFRFTVASNRSFDFHVSAGDGTSRRYHVAVVKRPQIESLAVGYALPAYTGQPAVAPVPLEGDLNGLPGTTVTLELKATKPLQEARLLIEGKPGKEVLPLSRGGDERAWHAAFVLWTAAAKAEAAPPGKLLSDPR